MKVLYPPLVPSSLPAFGSENDLKVYFRPSKVNSINQVNHAQITIHRLDTNVSELSEKDYPFGIIFKTKADIKEDRSRGYYYIELESSIFTTIDTAYKIQVRLGEDDISGLINNTAELGTWLKQESTLIRLSEWSNVCLVMPITEPEFEIIGFSDTEVNIIDTDGHTFQGTYLAKDEKKQEYLRSYIYTLYEYTENPDMTKWNQLSTSKELFVSEFDKGTLDYIFSYETKPNTNYLVGLAIKTKNLYTNKKIYWIKTKEFPRLNFFNILSIKTNEEEAKLDMTIKAKQVLFRPQAGTTVKFIKDNTSDPTIDSTHAKVDGTIVANTGFKLTPSTASGKVLIQFKAFFSNPHETLEDAYSNPNILIFEESNLVPRNVYTRIKISLLKLNVAYPITGNLEPEPEYEYRVLIKKEMYTSSGEVISSQNKVARLSDYSPKREYYFYILDDNGLMDVHYESTYLSNNEEI